MEKPLNTAPLLELAELFGKDGVVHKDLTKLRDSMESLIITLGRKSGKDKKEEKPRTLAGDWKDFTQELKNSLDPRQYLGMKKDIKKKEKEYLKKEAAEKNNLDDIDVKDAAKVVDKDESTTILSDMVDVLNALKDDTTQIKIYDQIVELKKTISDLNSITSKTIEPNDEAAKQEDREKLAEAIARRLSEVVGVGEYISGFESGDKDGKGKNKKDTPEKKSEGKSKGNKIGKIVGGAAAFIRGSAPIAATILGLNAIDEAAGQAGINKENNIDLLEYPEELDTIQEEQLKILNPTFGSIGTFSKGLEKVESFIGMSEIEKKQRRSRIEAEFVKINEGIKNLDNNTDITPEQKKRVLELEEQRLRIIKRSPKVESKSVVDTMQVISPDSETPPPAPPRMGQFNRMQGTSTVVPSFIPKGPDIVPSSYKLSTLEKENLELKYEPTRSDNSPLVLSSNKTINNRETNSIGDSITPYPMYGTFDRWQDKRSWGYDHA